MEEKNLSEAAKWFLKDFQKLLDDFSRENGVQALACDKKSELVTSLCGVQNACKLILSTEEGRIRCKDHFKLVSSLSRSQKKPICTECYAGFTSACVPIIIGSVIGTIISCGEKYDKGGSAEKTRKRFETLAGQLGIMDVKAFVWAATEQVKDTTEEKLLNRAEKLLMLVNILLKNVHTPLKEVFE